MLFYIILSIIVISLYIFGRVYYKVKGYKDECQGDDFRGNGFASVMAGFFIFVTVAFMIMSLILSSVNTYKIEDLQKVEIYEKILTEKADILTLQFTNYLSEIYPNLEKGIFEKISPQNVNIYLVKYPELKSSETIRKLVDEISKLQDDVYEQKLRRVEIQRDINFYYKNPWILFRF